MPMMIRYGFLFLSLFSLSVSTKTIAQASVVTELPSTLTIATIERKPFVIKNQGQFSGFSIDLLDAVANELQVNYRLVEKPSFDELLNAASLQQVDLSIANISITSERETKVDFSQPIFNSGLQIMAHYDSSSSGILRAIFKWSTLVWIFSAVLFIFIIANLMWFFERKCSPYFQKSYREGLWPSFWWSMHVMISGGFEEHVPRSIPARFLGVALVVGSLFIASIFIAKIASSMTVNELRSGIESYEDLYTREVGSTKGSTASAFLTEHSVRHKKYDNLDQLFAALEDKSLDAIVHDAPILQFYAANEGKGRVQIAGAIFKPETYGIALPQNSALRESINRALLKLSENGRYNEIRQKWFGE